MENGTFIVNLPIYPLKMMIFHSYVSLPEGNLAEYCPAFRVGGKRLEVNTATQRIFFEERTVIS